MHSLRRLWLRSLGASCLTAILLFSAHTADAAEIYNNAQLKLIFEGSTVYATGGSCINRQDALGQTYPGQSKFTLEFAKSGQFSIHSECDNTRSTLQTDTVGSWQLRNNRLCLESDDPVFMDTMRNNGENCMPVQETRFGFELLDDTANRVWFFQIEKHPAHSRYEDLLAALGRVKTPQQTTAVKAQPAPPPTASPAVTNAVQSASQPATSSAVADPAKWDEIKFSTQISDFQEYLATYPNGLFVRLAENQIRDLVAAQTTPASQILAEQVSGVEFGNYHALVIGINNYKHITKLETAVRDAKAITAILKEEYGFDVQTLIDPDRADIIDAFDEYRESLSDTDNLLIYYAGHGWLDDQTEEGYWLSANARSNRKSQWISNATIIESLKALPAKHVMVVADSCFSGTLTRAADIGYRDKDYLKRIARKKARVAMVSGGLEPVADDGGSGNSPFAKAFMDALKDNTGVVDGTRLFSQIRRPVILNARQTPEYSDVRDAGHDGGDFLFVRKR